MGYDLTDIDPHQRGEILKRLEAIERFNANPGRATAEREAERIGMSPSAFYGLVKAWNLHRDAAKLPGARHRRRSQAIDPTLSKLISQVAAQNPGARAGDIIFLVRQAAAGRDIDLPTDQTIGNHLRRLRKGSVPAMPDVSHFVDRCLWDIPVVADNGEIVRPVATLVVDRKASTPIGVHLGLEMHGAHGAKHALLDAIANDAFEPGSVVLVDRESDRCWRAVEEMVADAGITIEGLAEPPGTACRDAGAFRRRGNGRSILSTVGRFLAGHPMKVMSVKAMDRPSQEIPPVTLDDAAKILRGRLMRARSRRR